jgi:hypothetical protein
MKRFLFWLLAVLITLASAVYQKRTGPTYPLRVKASVGGSLMSVELPRSAESKEDLKIALPVPAPAEGYLEYKRYKTDDAWVREPLVRREAELLGFLPKQPAAGKLLYRVHLVAGGGETLVGGEEPVIVRFKDSVPLWLLIIHIIVMFAGMLAATAAGLAALDKKRHPRRFVLWAAGLIFVGGFILGPLVQKYAFGMFWSGFPVGMDLTDNKTLITVLFWIAALVAGRKGKPARAMVLIAAIVTLVVFLIPHSLLGSELKYTNMK